MLSPGGLSGSRQYRPTLNSYRCGEAMAISRIAAICKDLQVRTYCNNNNDDNNNNNNILLLSSLLLFLSL